MLLTIQRLCVAVCFTIICFPINAQSTPPAKPGPLAKPYKVMTSGKQITINSSRNIFNVMLWTTGGNRVVEQKDINTTNYTFTVPVNQKTFFLMISLSDGKVYTEKIGVR